MFFLAKILQSLHITPKILPTMGNGDLEAMNLQ